MIKYQILEDNFIRDNETGSIIKLNTGTPGFKYNEWLKTNTPIPLQPSEFHVFNETEMIWELDVNAEVNQQWDKIRFERDQLLKDSDFTQLPDSPFDTATKDSWSTYRQELRDIPITYSNPEDVIWPTKPS